ncbi:MAG: Structural maintenance of chromosomes protein 1B, partial [Paramarteilia canceri]
YKKQKESLNLEILEARESIQSIQNELDTLNNTLSAAESLKNDKNKKRKRAETLESLKNLFPGIKGRLCDLCEPRNSKYNLAIARIFGIHMYSIVTDDLKTAKECIKYLKSERIGTESFLPLDSLHKYSISASITRFAEENCIARMIDVLTFDESLKDLFVFICKDTLICQTTQKAREIAYETQD